MPQDKQEKLKSLLTLLDAPTKADIAKLFSQLLDFVKQIKNSNDQVFASIKSEIVSLSDKLSDTNQKELANAKKQITNAIERLEKENADNLNFVRDTLRRVKNGKDADETKIVIKASKIVSKKLLSLIPTLDTIKEKIKVTPEEIADKLELLTGDKRLEIGAIHNLEERLNELEMRPVGRLTGAGVGKLALEAHFIDNETPSGTVNGTNTDFVLANKPKPPGSLKVRVNGQTMTETEDYTLSNRTITFLTAPPTTSVIRVDYRT